MRINTNIMALNAQNMLTRNQSSVEKSIQKLSSGLRINSASDDAAGLAISEKMRSQIRGLDQAESNAQDGISLLQTAEGALQQTTDILQRMRELVIKAQNTGVLTDDDKVAINTEMSTLRDEVDRIASSTSFNSKKLLDGSLGTKLKSTTVSDGTKVNVAGAVEGKTYTVSTITGGLKIAWTGVDGTAQTETITSAATATGTITFAAAGVSIDIIETDGLALGSLAGNVVTEGTTEGERAAFKIGANTYEQDTLYVGIGDMSSTGLSNNSSRLSLDITTPIKANDTLDAIDYAIGRVSSQRATLGSIQNRMDYAISNLTTTQENLSAAESRIRDVDMASEMVSYTKDSILNQSAMAMLAQANQQPQSILALLQ